MKKNIVKMSLVAAMILTSSAYAAQITGADAVNAADVRIDNFQFGFGGLNLENVNVNLVGTSGTFDHATGEYPVDMDENVTVESSVFNTDDNKSDEAKRMGYIHQKSWPLSEPMGLKVINNDDTNNGKPRNCIMGSSYLNDENTTLDGHTPTPVLCSSPAGSNKRFSLALLPDMVAGTELDQYGESIDLVFNIESTDGDHRYQVFQKVNNFTGMRLDGLTIEVLDSTGNPNPNLTLSLGEGEALDNQGQPTGGDLFLPYEMAFYPPGLWGDGTKSHLPTGWFDKLPSGYNVIGHGTSELNTTTQLSGNYVEIYGNWIPEKWVGLGMHEVLDPLEEPVLLAYWGTLPTEDLNDTPAWHYGMYDNDSNFTDFATPTQDVFDAWAAEPERFVIDDIEDLPNLSLNYIVNVGVGIDSNFTIRFTPKVSVDQTPPSYISKEDNITYILPPEATPPASSGGGGGGCTYNPNSKNFDMTFLMLAALGLLYPFRRRFLK